MKEKPINKKNSKIDANDLTNNTLSFLATLQKLQQSGYPDVNLHKIDISDSALLAKINDIKVDTEEMLEIYRFLYQKQRENTTKQEEAVQKKVDAEFIKTTKNIEKASAEHHKKLKALDTQLDNHEKKISSLESEHRKFVDTHNKSKAELENIIGKKDEIQKELSELEEKLAENKKAIDEKLEKFDLYANEKVEEVIAKIKIAKDDSVKLKKQLEELQSLEAEMQDKEAITNKSQEVTTLDSQIDNLTKERETLDKELQSDRVALSKDVTNAIKKLESEFSNNKKTLEVNLKSLEMQIVKLTKEVAKLESDMVAKMKIIEEIKAVCEKVAEDMNGTHEVFKEQVLISVEKESKAHEAKLELLEQGLENVKAKLELSEESLEAKRVERDKILSDYMSIQEALQNHESNADILRQKSMEASSAFKEVQAAHNSETKELTAEIKKVDAEIKRLEKQLAKIGIDSKKALETLAKAKPEEGDKIKAQIDLLNKDKLETEEQKTAKIKALEQLNDRLDEIKHAVEVESSKVDDTKADFNDVTKKVAEHKAALKDPVTKLAKVDKELSALNAIQTKLEEEYSKIEHDIMVEHKILSKLEEFAAEQNAEGGEEEEVSNSELAKSQSEVEHEEEPEEGQEEEVSNSELAKNQSEVKHEEEPELIKVEHVITEDLGMVIGIMGHNNSLDNHDESL